MITPEQKEQWLKMHKRGMSFRAIAEHQDVGEATVRYAIMAEMDKRRLVNKRLRPGLQCKRCDDTI